MYFLPSFLPSIHPSFLACLARYLHSNRKKETKKKKKEKEERRGKEKRGEAGEAEAGEATQTISEAILLCFDSTGNS